MHQWMPIPSTQMPSDGPITFPDVEPGEDVVVSATTFVSFRRCPDQAAARLRGVYGAESRASFVGGLAHRIFARHLQDGPIGHEGLEAACREEIGAGLNQKMVSLGIKPSDLTGVIHEVGQLYERFKTMGAEGFEGAEVRLEAAPADGVLLRGSIDAVFESGSSGARLVDWKTGAVGDAGVQLSFYALLWTLERGGPPGSVEAVSVATGERVREVPTSAGVRDTAGQVAEMVSTLRRAWRDGGTFERHAGPWCRWCPLLDDCSEGRAAVAILGS
jgi:hypothetical protein